MNTTKATYESIHFHIPAEITQKIAKWVHAADEAYLINEINRHGAATIISDQGKIGFQRIKEIPKPSGSVIPYYGTIGGVYNFIFSIEDGQTKLRIRHSLAKQFKLSPFEIKLEKPPVVEHQREVKNYWFSNRLETLLEKPNQDFRFYIDGDIFSNMLAVSWKKETLPDYQYKFTPTTVGCFIIIRHIATTQTFDLTADIEW